LISIDTCRADYLSCYGYPRQTTPNIDAIAEEGILFENVISPVPITLPAHSSMLTGTIPPYHGVHDNGNYQLDESNVTLAQILKQSGFTTGGIISSLVLDPVFGINQGFDTYNDQFEEERKTLGNITERIGAEASHFAITWLQQHKDEKFFLFLHYFDPHAAYVPPEPFASKFADNLYAGEIAYTDHCIGLVLSKLKELELYDSTLIIITADHGEMLNEHGEPSHGYFIYQSAVKVPLIFRLPGKVTPRRIKGIVGLVDITPTICSLLGIEVPSQIQGMDLSACIKGHQPEVHDRHFFCECFTATKYNGNSLLAVVTDRWKYIQTTRPELYDLVKDPHETKNLINQQPHQGRILQDRLKQILEKSVRKDKLNDKIVLDNERRERLESLGYVAGGVIEDFNFDQTRDDPKDLINFHNANMNVIPLLAQEMYDQAKVVAEKLVHERPDCHVGYKQLARIARKQKDHSANAFYLNKLLEFNPNDYKSHSDLGSLLALQGKPAEALSHYRQALRIVPDNAQTHYNLGTVLQSQDKLAEAIDHLTEATRLDPVLTGAHYQLGKTFFLQDKLDEAVVHLTEAVRIRPKFAKAHTHLALALVRQGKVDEAVAHLTEALQLNPDIGPAHYALARALNGKGQTKEAIIHFKETLRTKPDWENPMNSLAWILATHSDSNIRDPQEALTLAQRACEIANYEDPGFLDTLAAAYATSGRFKEAVTTAEKAIQIIASGDNKKRIQKIQNRLDLYREQKPYRQLPYTPKKRME
jgi:arylsulfatase A-like enzyme/Flp pilus assembly protein TadD